MASRKNNTPLTPWVCFISRLSTRFMGSEMSRIGFGPGQFFLLSELFETEGLRQDELSQRVGVDKSNTSRALAKLESYGLVRRESDPENHRAKKVYLTEKAHVIKNKFKKIQRHWNAELLNGLTETEKAALLSGLKKVAANAETVFDQLFRQTPNGGATEKQRRCVSPTDKRSD